MDVRHDSQRTRVSAGLDHSEEMLAEVDEPPDDYDYFSKTIKHTSHAPTNVYSREQLLHATRRESLLTRQLNSENDNSTEEDERAQPPRGLSAASVWSTQSTTSTAELTSDDGRSISSPTTSPPLRPVQNGLSVPEKPLSNELRIVGLDAIATQDKPKDEVEAGLGRKRCITFACGNKGKEKPVSPPTPPPTEEERPASPPKRKCMIKFACPARAGAENKPSEPLAGKRPVSPPPPQRRTPQQTRPTAEKAHRGSDSTVTHVSPKNIRNPSTTAVTTRIETAPTLLRKLSNGSDSGGEGTRFHEFATSDDEPEEWIQESTCWRSRLTVTDTLKKENIIRQLGEEVDEEALQEEDEDDLDDEDDDDPADEDDDDDEDDDEEDVDEVEEDDSDDGFHSDDEEGFAVSDSEGEDSENEWWTPAGRSTAATSMDHLHDHLTTNQFKTDRSGSTSSINSSSSRGQSPKARQRRHRHHKHSKSQAVDIQRSDLPDLPDSTDFVCGTLDEDRPIEQAYITRIKEREAAKHKLMPQDIDPTFPTSDPEMDEEDDDDIEDPEESESEVIMLGTLEQIHGTERRTSFTPTPRRKSAHRSPPPPMARHRSPAPRRPSPAPKRATRRSPPPRAGSPAPRRPSPAPTRISTRAKSPPPPPRRPSPAPARRSARAGSPAPVRRSNARSPPPVKRSATEPVRKLFGQSPPPPRTYLRGTGMTSPPNTRRTSPSAIGPSSRPLGIGLGARPAPLTHTASLPRAGGFQISRMDRLELHDMEDESDTAGETPLKRRGAIDIVKGLEKKRLRRKEKMHQKACAKAAAKGEKQYKVRPGKGCERMREVGLELQRYKGKGEHILSV